MLFHIIRPCESICMDCVCRQLSFFFREDSFTEGVFWVEALKVGACRAPVLSAEWMWCGSSGFLFQSNRQTKHPPFGTYLLGCCSLHLKAHQSQFSNTHISAYRWVW